MPGAAPNLGPYNEYGDRYGGRPAWAPRGNPGNVVVLNDGGRRDGLLYGWYLAVASGLNGGVGYVRCRRGCVGGRPGEVSIERAVFASDTEATLV